MNFEIRVATEDDLPAITNIYNQAVALRSATADISPVSLESRKKWFEQHKSGTYPVFVAEGQDVIVGWCSLSAYRPGRSALRYTAEISYYIDEHSRGMGVGSSLISHAIENCTKLGFKTLFAIVLDINRDSTRILGKLGFEEWGHMPNIADFDGLECGHLYYGLRVAP
jgi:L-amino acid N-acyltransferase YncA